MTTNIIPANEVSNTPVILDEFGESLKVFGRYNLIFAKHLYQTFIFLFFANIRENNYNIKKKYLTTKYSYQFKISKL
jgi:hypothetical protein